ncbi:unnamed protein product [Sphenostylis stenocarpa]|uniref:Uncharacterized protein n=1 Tax=Sphenostylis stenocarpa TaxID=92480 RepID=A0AA86SWM6_9FABA|nr:unnamed protein product [Sphenostylis stenocarpa]
MDACNVFTYELDRDLIPPESFVGASATVVPVSVFHRLIMFRWCLEMGKQGYSRGYCALTCVIRVSVKLVLEEEKFWVDSACTLKVQL